MSSVQLTTAGSQGQVIGTAQLTVNAPAAEVSSVGFHVTDCKGRRRGPLGADRTPAAGVYEKDVLLDAGAITRVEPEVVLADGSVRLAATALFGPRNEPIAAAPGTLAAFTVAPQPLALEVSVSLGTAARWKCYARRGASPAAADPNGLAPSEEYLRFVGDSTALAFSMSAAPGTWHLIGIGCNSAGQPGPQRVETVEVTA